MSIFKNLFNAVASDVISFDFAPLNPVAASDMLLIPDAMFDSLLVSNDRLFPRLSKLDASLSMESLAFAESALIFICNSSISAMTAPTFYT